MRCWTRRAGRGRRTPGRRKTRRTALSKTIGLLAALALLAGLGGWSVAGGADAPRAYDAPRVAEHPGGRDRYGGHYCLDSRGRQIPGTWHRPGGSCYRVRVTPAPTPPPVRVTPTPTPQPSADGRIDAVRVEARRLADGRIEVAISMRDGDRVGARVLPDRRHLDAEGATGWERFSWVGVESGAPVNAEAPTPTPTSDDRGAIAYRGSGPGRWTISHEGGDYRCEVEWIGNSNALLNIRIGGQYVYASHLSDLNSHYRAGRKTTHLHLDEAGTRTLTIAWASAGTSWSLTCAPYDSTRR